MPKALVPKEQAKFQAYQLFLTSRISMDKIGAKFGVCRQTIANWIKDVRQQIDEPAIIEAARKDLIELVPESTRYYHRAVGRQKIDMVGLIAATNVLKKNKLLAEESSTTNINITVLEKKRETNLETGLKRFRLIPAGVNGNGTANPSDN